MYGSDIGRLVVLVRAVGQQQNYLIWQKTGNQGNQWRKAVVFISIAGEFQVRFISWIQWVTYSGGMSLSKQTLSPSVLHSPASFTALDDPR